MGTRSLEVPFDDPARAARVIVAHDAATPLDAVVAVDDVGTVVAAEASALPGAAPQPARRPWPRRATSSSCGPCSAGSRCPSPPSPPSPPEPATTPWPLAVEDVGLPCVIKPTTLSGSQGVLRADTRRGGRGGGGARAAHRGGRRASPPTHRCSSSVSCPAPRWRSKASWWRATCDVLAVFDKPDPLDGPAFEETIYVTPSRLAPVRPGRRAAVTAGRHGRPRAAPRARSTPRCACATVGRAVIEVAARTIGGSVRAGAVVLHGTLPRGARARPCAGPGARATPGPQGASGVLMIPIAARRHAASAWTASTTARAVPGVVDVEITVAPGEPVAPVPRATATSGSSSPRDATPARVETALAPGLGLSRRAHRRLGLPRHGARPEARGRPAPPRYRGRGARPAAVRPTSSATSRCTWRRRRGRCCGPATRCAVVDLAVDPLDVDAVSWADAVACSVPMHTAMRLARPAVRAEIAGAAP